MKSIAEVANEDLFCTECVEYANDCKLACNNITDNQAKKKREDKVFLTEE